MTAGYAIEPSARPSAFGSGKSFTPFSRMQSAILTALSRAVAFWSGGARSWQIRSKARAHQGEHGKDGQWPERSLMVPLLLR